MNDYSQIYDYNLLTLRVITQGNIFNVDLFSFFFGSKNVSFLFFLFFN
jgi:hypothetical protein